MRHKIIGLFACLGMVACAPTVWDKPGATQAGFNQDSARCRLLARGMNSGDFYAEGSAQFVAAAAVGNALGTAINQRASYHDCMMSVGYTPQSPMSSAQADSAAYGAVAFDGRTAKYGFAWNEDTQKRADEAALRTCNSESCKIVFPVPPRRCGALATSETGNAWGGNVNDARDKAALRALENCQKRTSGKCVIRGSDCNR